MKDFIDDAKDKMAKAKEEAATAAAKKAGKAAVDAAIGAAKKGVEGMLEGVLSAAEKRLENQQESRKGTEAPMLPDAMEIPDELSELVDSPDKSPDEYGEPTAKIAPSRREEPPRRSAEEILAEAAAIRRAAAEADARLADIEDTDPLGQSPQPESPPRLVQEVAARR